MVNGKKQPVSEKPGSYVTVERDWKSGDTVQVQLPMSLRMESMPDDPKTVALLYGPIVLAGELGKEDWMTRTDTVRCYRALSQSRSRRL